MVFFFHKGNLEAFIQTINHANEISNQQYSSLVAGMCKSKRMNIKKLLTLNCHWRIL